MIVVSPAKGLPAIPKARMGSRLKHLLVKKIPGTVAGFMEMLLQGTNDLKKYLLLFTLAVLIIDKLSDTEITFIGLCF